MKRQLLPFLVTLGGLAAVVSLLLLLSLKPAAALPGAASPAAFSSGATELYDFSAGQRLPLTAPPSDVRFQRPRLEQWSNLLRASAQDPYPVGSLTIYVNYAYDWVEGSTDAGVTISVTVKAQDDSLKAEAVVVADGVGYYSVECEGWSAGACPDIVPGDKVQAAVDDTIAEVNPVGHISGVMDEDSDTVSGTLLIPGTAGNLLVSCQVWTGSGPLSIETTADPAGGVFSCDFSSGASWDLRRGDVVALTYFEADGDRVTNILTWPWVRANYAHEWAGANYEMGHTFWLTVTDSSGAAKATATAESTSGGGWGEPGFMTEEWSPMQPDIQPGDWVHFAADDGYSNSLHVGAISATLDVDADRIDGQVFASDFGVSLTVECHPWGAWDAGIDAPLKESWAEPNGSTPFSCQWTPAEWDIQPGQDLAAMYVEPDWDRVIDVYRDPAPYLRIDKWTADQPAEGGNLRFTIEYWNEGDAPAEVVTITDVMLGGLTYISDTSGLLRTGDGSGPITWQAGQLEDGQRASFDVFVGVTAPVSAAITNTAQIEASVPWDQGDPAEKVAQWSGVVGGNDTYLTVDKWAWTGDPAPGETFVFNVNVCNVGSTGSAGVTLTDTLGLGLTLVDWWPGQPGWVEVSRDPSHLVVAYPIVGGQSCTEIYLEAHLDAAVELGSLVSNTAVIEAANDLSADDNVVIWEGEAGPAHTNLGIEKSFNRGQLVPGGEVNYGVHFYNSGNVPVGPFLVTDTLPAGTTFAGSWVHDEQGEHPLPPLAIDDDTIVWAFPGLGNGFNFDFEVRVTIAVSVEPGSALVNEVAIQPQADEDTYDDNEALWADEVYDRGPNLRVSKWGQWDDWGANTRQAAYWIQIANIGDVLIEGVIMTDTYPAGFVLGDGPDSEWWRLVGWEDDPDQHRLTAEFDYLEPGEATWFNFAALAPGEDPLPLGEIYGNLVEVEPAPGEDELEDNIDEVFLTSGPDLFVEKNLVNRGLLPGELVTFSLAYGNDRNDNEWWWGLQANGVLTDVLPDGLEYVSAVLLNCGPEGEPCPFEPTSDDGRTLVWQLAPLGPGAGDELLLTTRISAGAKNGDLYHNQVEILSSQPDLDLEPDYANNEDGAGVAMVLPELEIGKRYDGSRLPGSIVTYSLRFSNTGAMAASGLVITDHLPGNMTWLNGGDYDGNSQIITWDGPDLAIGASGEVTFSGELACSGQVVNDRYQVATSDQGVSGPMGPEVAFTILTPTIEISFSHSAGPVAGVAARFQASASSNGPAPLSYDWDFGDGEGAVDGGASPDHVYESHGDYTVVVTATDPCLYAASHEAVVTVNQPDIAAGFDLSDDIVPIHGSVAFTDTSSTNGAAISGWLWDFGDGSAKSNQQNPSHTYDSHGAYTVTLTVTDALGYEGTVVEANAVRTLAPVFEIGKAYESNRVAGTLVTYTLTVTNNGDLTGTGLVISDRLPSNVTWVSGGVYDIASGSISWSWPSLAVGHTVELSFVGRLGCAGQAANDRYRVSGSDQGIASPWGAPLSFTILAPTIQAGFSQSASRIAPGGTVQFTDMSASNGGPLVTFDWDFDDGQTGSGATISHLFAGVGQYDVELTVADACGFGATASHSVEVGYWSFLPLIANQ